MLLNSKPNRLAIGSTLAISLTLSAVIAQSAQAIPAIGSDPVARPIVTTNSFDDCNTAGEPSVPNADIPICIQGAGATFPFPLFAGGTPDSTPVGIFRFFAPNQVNYAARGSGTGISSYLSQTPPSGSPTVGTPFAFASTDAPMTQTQINSYYASNWNLGYGPIVEVPIATGAVSIVINDGAGPRANEAAISSVSRADMCAMFNANGPVVIDGVTYDGTVAGSGVRRTDSSGTTFIMSSHLYTVCTPTGDWETPTGTNRGFGQVSVPDTTPACATEIVELGGSRTNTVCWPSTFTSGSGNPGVAAEVDNGPTGSFGYVEFATAVANNDGSVDIDINPSTATIAAVAPNGTIPGPAGSINDRRYPNIDVTAVQNRSGNFRSPISTNVQFAFTEQADDSAATCRIVFNAPDPTAANGYPIIGANYGLFYGDYTPDRTPTGNPSPRINAFQNQGDYLRDRHRAIVNAFSVNAIGRSIATSFGYAPIPTTTSVANGVTAARVFTTANSCINSISGSAPTTDAPPAGAVFP